MIITFNQIVEEIKSLKFEDKLYLKELFDNLIRQEKRRLIKKHYEESIKEYKDGKIKFGNIDELISDLYET